MAGREPLLQDENPREDHPGGGRIPQDVEPVVRHAAGREEERQGASPGALGYAGMSDTRDWAGNAPPCLGSHHILRACLLGVWRWSWEEGQSGLLLPAEFVHGLGV